MLGRGLDWEGFVAGGLLGGDALRQRGLLVGASVACLELQGREAFWLLHSPYFAPPRSTSSQRVREPLVGGRGVPKGRQMYCSLYGSEVRILGAEARGRKPEAGSQRPESRGLNPDSRIQKVEQKVGLERRCREG